MREYTITVAQLPKAWQHEIQMNLGAVIKGLHSTAMRAKGVVQKEGPVDQGIFSGSWQVVNVPLGAELRNDTPYAGIIEDGSRPHWPPPDPIRAWIIRKIKDIGVYRQSQGEDAPLTTKDGKPRSARHKDGKIIDSDQRIIDSLTFLVCRAISQKGTKPHHILRNNQPVFAVIMQEEVKKALTSRG